MATRAELDAEAKALLLREITEREEALRRRLERAQVEERRATLVEEIKAQLEPAEADVFESAKERTVLEGLDTTALRQLEGALGKARAHLG